MQVETVEDLRAQAQLIAEKIDKIQDAGRYQENKKLEGKAFKYRNNYSCPEKTSDYWWLYIRVLKVSKDHIDTHEFETDKYGQVTINMRKRYYRHLFGAGSRIEIKPSEFERAWKAVLSKLSNGERA